MSKFVGTGPSSYEKKDLPGRGLTMVEEHCSRLFESQRQPKRGAVNNEHFARGKSLYRKLVPKSTKDIN